MAKNTIIAGLIGAGHVDVSRAAVWRDTAELLAIIDAIAREGATALIKIDGARAADSVYTVLISGGRLGETYFRKDGADLRGLLEEAIEFYNTSVWSRGGSSTADS
jgi:hypothetical protein